MRAYKLIDAERVSFPVTVLCKVLSVSRSGYYSLRDRPPSSRAQQDAKLTTKIRETRQRSRHTYGSPRVQAELRSIGIRCGSKRVARLMKEAGLRGYLRAWRRSTTRRDRRAVPAEDLLKRDLVPQE